MKRQATSKSIPILNHEEAIGDKTTQRLSVGVCNSLHIHVLPATVAHVLPLDTRKPEWIPQLVRDRKLCTIGEWCIF